jgi:serine/threonine protein kinase
MRLEDTFAGVLRGRRLAHFELLEPIGVGGMGAVIRARDTQLDRTVALKILPPEMAADPENVRRFHQEARAAAKLDHENIARVFFCGEDQGLHFIAFEFVEGENLRTLMERRGRIPVREAIHYLLQIATGLAHAAARGVVHRDIKPSNIIISPNGRAKLVDMGLARSLEPRADGALTQSGVTLGTFDYISPEQALEPREADVRSDIYSLGCTLYHMLTGQPPVPEGTAARKLHHHQSVAPLDPRQLNPDIPDEVAALLARMMAKNPRERYQRPEELVGHLIVLAQQLGGVSQGADSVLFVDAPLLGQPRTRPLLVVCSAVLTLVLLIGILGPWPSSPKPAPEENATQVAHGMQKTGAGNAEAPADGTGNSKPHTEPVIIHSHDAKELADLFKKKDPVVKVYLTGDLHLSRDNALLFQGRDLTVEADGDLVDLPTISLRSDASASDESWTALTVQSGTVLIRRVRFELDSGLAENIRMTAVRQQGGHLTLKNCAFFQEESDAGLGQGRMSSVTVSGPMMSEEKPSLILNGCYFARGQNAVTLTRPAEVEARQCAFGPHSTTLFDLQSERNGSTSRRHSVKLQNCSAFLVGDSAFRFEGGASCRLSVDNCVFSGPGSEAMPHGLAALIEQADSKPISLSYTNARNCYHNLKALWVRSSRQGSPETITDWNGFKEKFEVKGEKPLEWTSSPWENPNPLQALRNEPSLAFRLKTNVLELRQPDHPTHLIGVEHCVWGDSYKEKLPLLEEKKAPEQVARREERIVDPSLPVPKENIYRTLRQALEDTKPGDVILIKHEGILLVEPVRLEKAGVDVSIKPHPGYHPILSIGQTTEQDAAMFRIYDGQLRLESLEFQLAPGSSPFKAQTAVAVMGDGQCTLKECVVTMEGAKDVPLALVTVADPAGVMKMEPPAVPQADPRITIEECFARGTGNLVAVRASRPFELRVEKSLAVLDGSLLVIDGSPKEAAPRGRAQVSLEQVTTYLTDHLVWLRASQEESKSLKGLVPTQFKTATNCLFVSAGGKALVHLEGVDTEDQMKRLFYWGESAHNLYSNFTQSLLDQQPSGGNDGAMAPPPYGKAQWEGFTGEQDARFERVRFGVPLPADTAFAKVLAADFKLKSEANLQGYGADPDALPKPADVPASNVLTPEN